MVHITSAWRRLTKQKHVANDVLLIKLCPNLYFIVILIVHSNTTELPGLKNEACTNSHLAMYAWLSTLSGTLWMLASIGTLAIAGRTALSTGYVATEIIISHHILYIWFKQTNTQTEKQTSCLVTSTPLCTDRQSATIKFWESLSTTCNSHT